MPASRVSRPQITEGARRASARSGHAPDQHALAFRSCRRQRVAASSGAKIIAQENTRKHLSAMQRVEDWDYNFPPSPSGGPADRGLRHGAEPEAERLHHRAEVLRPGAHRQRHLRHLRRGGHPSRRRHLLERHLSFHRLFDRRQHRRHDRGLRRQPGGRRPTRRSSFPGHGQPVSNEPSCRNSATCWSPSVTTSRSSSSRDDPWTRRRGQADRGFDAKWGNFVISPASSPGWSTRACDCSR